MEEKRVARIARGWWKKDEGRGDERDPAREEKKGDEGREHHQAEDDGTKKKVGQKRVQREGRQAVTHAPERITYLGKAGGGCTPRWATILLRSYAFLIPSVSGTPVPRKQSSSWPWMFRMGAYNRKSQKFYL